MREAFRRAGHWIAQQFRTNVTLRVATGIGLVVLGVLGLIVPVMPGWAFLIPGLLILADYYPPIHRVVQWARQKAGQVQEAWRDRGRR